MPGSFGATNADDGADVFTSSSSKSGIFVHNDATSPSPANIPGGNGVFGQSSVPNASGVFGLNTNGGTGVAGSSGQGDGMQAFSSSSAKSGIHAFNNATSRSPANIPGGNGVFGQSSVPNASGVFGLNTNGGAGVAGSSGQGDGVAGFSNAGGKSGVAGFNSSASPDSNGVYGSCKPPGNAGKFDGNVQVNGDMHVSGTLSAVSDIILAGAASDCAEDFDVAADHEVEPGTVMVLDDGGSLRPSEEAYDRKVAGVISGAGEYRPGLILGRCESSQHRVPIALVGSPVCPNRGRRFAHNITNNGPRYESQ
jgi:hypothetical protein